MEIINIINMMTFFFCLLTFPLDLILQLVDAGMFLEYEHFNYIIKLLHQLEVPSQEIDIVLNIKSRYVLKELFYSYIYLVLSSSLIL